MLATGGSDAVVNLWHDCTAFDKEEAFRIEVNCPMPFFVQYLSISNVYMLDVGMSHI